MKKQLQTLIARLDALSLRERLFLFVSVLLCSGALFDVLWLSPAQNVHRQLVVRIDKQAAELQRLREVLKTTAQPSSPLQGVVAELQHVRRQSEQTDLAVRALLPPAQGMPLVDALTHLLRRQPGLTLVKTSALAPEVAGPGDTQAAGLPVGLTRQGVAITVAGAYPDLTRFVLALETDMPQVRWGAMAMKSDQGAPELTLNLFLLAEVTP
jgi:MSHA biogenesis protein MshJ